mmetsp:Transcript_42338/g.99553  ORF Transcript_42338/g.99553 Transcript_42338/m.99553 type:complete len:213 (-) Transcript_42338:1419-2057(-)
MPERSTSWRSVSPSRSTGCHFCRRPPRLPTGVRNAPTMTGSWSFMFFSWCKKVGSLGVAARMLGADALLVELADAGLGDGFDEQDLIWQLPLGEGAGQVFLQLLLSRLLAGPQHHQGQRPFLPLRMGNADHRGVAHGRVAHEQVFHVDGRNPFTTALDHVLDAVGDFEVAVLVHRADIARAPPSAFQETVCGIRHVVVSGRYPGAAQANLAR